MYAQLFEELGLSPNEGKLYESLLRCGELGIGELSLKAKVHRRNVYDSIKRLLDRGLVQEIVHRRESTYRGVTPAKLEQLLDERRARLARAMPSLLELYSAETDEEFVTIYHGIEGWKSYMRDIIRVGEPYYCLGAKGGWIDERIRLFFLKTFLPEIKRRRIELFHLFDREVLDSGNQIINHVGPNLRFLPAGFSSNSSVEIFGPYVNIISRINVGEVDSRESFAVIQNRRIADSFRTWFRLIWEHTPPQRSGGGRAARPARKSAKRRTEKSKVRRPAR